MGQKQRLTLPGHYANVKRLCQFVARGAAGLGFDETAVFHIELACDEACTNIIEHAYGGEGRGEITISWQVVDDMFVVTIHDDGRQFDPTIVPPPPVVETPEQTQALDNIKVGGLGLHFIRHLMDEVTYTFDPKKGNNLIMKKQMGTK